MATCHFIVAIITAKYRHSWPTHKAAGWAACALIWVFAAAFGYSWGPAPWVFISEIFPCEWLAARLVQAFAFGMLMMLTIR